ncbi:MAG: NAD(P)-dependent oxidoreductase [Bacteroidota bacterium]|nr:NAD(P)-dependent oxidoreductase [Bacteroidota bacterium]
MKKILFLDTVHDLIREELTKNGYVCEPFSGFNRDELKKIIGDYFGIIIRSKFRLDSELLSLADNLHFIGRVGSGLENIDTAFAAKKNILCLNSPEGNRDAVGEHALGLLLSLMDHINRADRQVREGRWEREGNRGNEIKGKTIGIIGYGNMGSSFAQRLKGFEARVISYDKYKKGYSDGNTVETSLNEIFETADILSLHVPLTEETHYMVNSLFLEKFKKDIWFVNTSRGPVVKTSDLICKLHEGKIRGAALDVLEYEAGSFEDLSKNLPEEYKILTGSDRVVLTPHIAGWTHESYIGLARVLVDKILEAFPGSR